uniref:Uncharacterized protein n=1 Tax=Babesia bovis TaxID=5865 RepID=S6B1U3_BABBO|nr:hypothetical protein [Babesia bovis]
MVWLGYNVIRIPLILPIALDSSRATVATSSGNLNDLTLFPLMKHSLNFQNSSPFYTPIYLVL